ncbi:hypothetical protein F2Q70_00019728 [Brassica cretica]|uniref:F-box domain-containing protein n=1 Tax=Brassica cretica TaxID=69181 RepID=A0A8S9GPW5_BRACR|nr:hypothetical protein F2Q70_00019728 [Brassica cretica]
MYHINQILKKKKKKKIWFGVHEELVANILTRLPLGSIIRFKLVCKSWRSLIESDFFRHKGLVLLHHESSIRYYIGNPVLSQWTLLPPPPPILPGNRYYESGLVTRMHNGVILDYKVVRLHENIQSIHRPNPRTLSFEIYSSDTGEWSYKHVSCPGDNRDLVIVCNPITLNGKLYWHAEGKDDGIVVYDFFFDDDQARLHKPASKVISHRGKLEKDIFSSLDLRNHTKVTVLSLHQPAASNFTEVKFGVLPVLTNHTLRKDSLTSLRSSFVNLFAQRSSLNLNKSTFGKPTSFQVLKFPGGITVDPLGLEPVSGLLTLVFSFTLDVSLSEIQHKVDLLKNQLELVLHLEMFESFRVVLTNHKGSTISPPVTVRGCVVSTTMTTVESHIQQRSNNLAQPPAKNFGLDNSAFGEVRNVTFTAYPEGTVLDSDSVLALTPSS